MEIMEILFHCRGTSYFIEGMSNPLNFVFWSPFTVNAFLYIDLGPYFPCDSMRAVVVPCLGHTMFHQCQLLACEHLNEERRMFKRCFVQHEQ